MSGRSLPRATRRGLAAGFAVLAAVVLLGACGGSAPERTAYTFRAGDSPVKVDTPALRAMKAQAGIAACPSGTTGSSAVADGMPDVTLPCLGGGPEVDLAGLRGPLLVNFWAQTCGPCRTESPLLEQFARAAKGQVGVVGVDFYDPRPGMAIEFAKARGVTYPQLADPDGVSKGPLRIAALPYTFFVAPSGRIAYTQVGPISSPAQLATLVEQHLGVTLATGAGR